MFLPPCPPRLFLAFAAATPTLQSARHAKTPFPGLRYFRNPPPRPRPGDGPPPDDRDKREVYNPLSESEQKAYLILAGIGCLPFLLLILLAIITHSPLMAN